MSAGTHPRRRFYRVVDSFPRETEEQRQKDRGESHPTVGALGGVDGVELADARHEADVGLDAVVGVVSRRARHEVGGGGREAELVEESRDAGGGEAAPVVVVAIEHAGEDRDLGVAWSEQGKGGGHNEWCETQGACNFC